MWAEMKKGFRDLDRERVLEKMGLERRRTTAERVVPFFAIFGAGVLVGVGVGMMFAPRAGRELRGELKEKLEEGVPRAAEVIQSAVENARAAIPQPSASAPHS